MDQSFSANCPICGPVSNDPREARVQVLTTKAGAAYVSYVCPRHRGRVVCRISDEALAVFEAAGYRAREAPEEVLEVAHGPALTLDELIDLHFALEDPDLVEKLRRGDDGPRGRADCVA